ncbi:hypothetical protein E4U47_004378 [Claviceps purpurea]|nr:hypothetical protein E4U26_005894 [Claviceps purpurea]KAG6268937.1 hypothetical protein E4U47_004378 [Claviceps purpurea]
MSTNKMALNFTIRDAAATRGYASDTDFEVYSKALEQMPQFLSMKGSKTSLYTPYRRPQYRDVRLSVRCACPRSGTASTKGALRAERAAVWRAGAKTREAENGGGGRENYANMAW